MKNRIRQMNTKITIRASGLNFPEGPAIDSKGDIWFVEMKGGNVCRLRGNNQAIIQQIVYFCLTVASSSRKRNTGICCKPGLTGKDWNYLNE
jgi:sugar lactone lactonase YvrE